MSDNEVLYQPYDQFVLFGDSITQYSCSQELGFGFFGALQHGKYLLPYFVHIRKVTESLLAYIRKMDVINRGFAYVH